jgi:XTP/dITP diphosphohydrolase
MNPVTHVAPLLLATRNRGKLLELRALFAGLSVALVDLAELGLAESAAEDALEAFETFEENALAKARHFHARSGLPTVADDSGLSVGALRGAPGVRSKRFANASGASDAIDEANNVKLLAELGDASDRTAWFVCAAAYVDADRSLVTRGEVPGRVLQSARGTGGFGYDPLFLSDELGQTFAEASLEAKETVSHRGRAFRALVAELRRSGAVPG